MRAQRLLGMFGATLITACHDSVAPPPPAPPPPPIVSLYYLKTPTNSGDNQTDTVLATLALPFRVLVRRGDTPAHGVEVLWEMYDDSVGVFRDTVLTDTAGIATSPLKLKLGRWPGTYAARASVPGLIQPGPIFIGTDFACGSALCFNATATAATPTQLRSVSGDGQSLRTNTPLAADYVVQIMDTYGNAVAGVVIDWAVTTGGGSITPTRDTSTLPNGYASARHTLGPASGTQTATATASGLPGALYVAFTATAFTPQLDLASGDGQTGATNAPLNAYYVVRTTDADGNGVAGVVIDWAVATGGGSLTTTRDTTMLPNGYARARHTLGPAIGTQTVTATASGLPGAPYVMFTATAFTPADISGIWDWTELYVFSSCADTGSYIFNQTNGAFSGSSQQVGMCYLSTGPKDNTHEDPVSNGIVVGDSITFFVTAKCVYYGTVSGNPPDHITGTTRCGTDDGAWQAVREQDVAAVTVTPDSQSVQVGATLQLTAQLRDANSNRLFFRPIMWVSDNPAVASVSPAGIVLAVSAGAATITASAGGQSGTATVLVP
jgi:hypothetical protein